MELRIARTAVIIDRHPLGLDALEALLGRLDVRVVARTTLSHDAEALLSRHRPDLLIADYAVMGQGGGSGGWSALARARRCHPSVRCIVLSDRDEPAEREQAFSAGATVFCAKTARGDDLLFAIRQSFEHSIYFARTGGAAPQARVEWPDDHEKMFDLTRREIQILRLVADGHPNARLAQTLWVTEKTIKFHLSNIYRKLDVANRTEAGRWAQLHGLLAAEETEVEVAVA